LAQQPVSTKKLFGGLRWAVLGVAFVLGLAAAAPAPDISLADLTTAARSEGKVVWYSGGALEPTNALAARFKKAYPGIDVSVLRLIGAQQYQRFSQEADAGHNIADILWLSDKPSMVDLIGNGHIAEWPIPTIDRFDAQYKIGKSAYAFNRVTSAIIYNETRLTDDEVAALRESWSNILQPRFKGRLAVTTARCGACYVPVHMFLDPQLREAFPADFLARIAAQKPAVFSDFIGMVDRVVAGEEDMAFWSFESAGATRRADGAPVRWLYPDPTPSFPSTWMGVPKQALHPNAARLFMDWMGSTDGALALQQAYFADTTISGVPDQREFTKENWYRAPKTYYQIDFDRWDRNYDSDMDRWIGAISRNK
jgi:ABC-type Fe3+ transport system substrate-binding protein